MSQTITNMVPREENYSILDLRTDGLKVDRYFDQENSYDSVPDFQNQTLEGVSQENLRDKKIINVAPGGSIQNAIDLLGKAGGGIVRLQAGIYDQVRDLYLTSDVSLIGNGPNSVIDFGGGNFGIRAEGSDVYDTGNISVENGSDTITGYGTTWTSDMVGMLIMIAGATYEITAVNSTTELEISPLYRGPDLEPTADSPVYESVVTSAFSGQTAGSNRTLAKPTGLAVGDLMVVHLATVDNTSGGSGGFNLPSGWTDLYSGFTNVNLNSCVRNNIFSKFADSSDVAASDFSFQKDGTPTNAAGAALFRISNAAAVAAGGDNDNNTTTPSFVNATTPTANNALLLFLLSSADAGQASGTASGYAIAVDNPTWTERYDFSANLSSDRGLMSGATASRYSIEAPGNFSCTLSNHSQNHLGVLVSITSNTFSTSPHSYVIFNPTTNIHMESLTVQNSSGTGIYAQYVAGEFVVWFINVYDCAAGLYIDHCELPTINIVILGITDGNGIEVKNSSSMTLQSAVSLEITNGHALSLDSVSDSMIHNASFSGASGNGINMVNCSNIGIENLSVLGNTGKGCEMTDCTEIQFNMTTFSINGSDGLKLTSGCDRNIIIQNSFIENGGYGLNIAAASDDDNNHAHNVYSGNTSGTVNNLGTNTATS